MVRLQIHFLLPASGGGRQKESSAPGVQLKILVKMSISSFLSLLGVRCVELNSSYVCKDGVVYDQVCERANGTVVLENYGWHGKDIILDENLERPSIDKESVEEIRKELTWQVVEKMTSPLNMGNFDPDFAQEFRKKVFDLIESL